MYAERALQRLRQAEHPLPTLEGTLYGSIGYAHHLRGRSDLAAQYFDKAIVHFEKVGRERGPDAISVRNNAAVARSTAGDIRRSLQLYDQTLQIVAQNDANAPLPPYLVANRARVLEDLGRFESSREEFLRCLGPSGVAPNLVSQTNCLAGLTSVSLALGDVDGAKKTLASVATLVGHSEPGSPEIVALQTLRGRIAVVEHRLDEARTNFDAAIANGRSQSQILRALLLRSDLDLSEGQVSAAKADARRALSLAQTLQGSLPYSNNTGLAWLALGEALSKQADDAGAQQAFHTAVAQLSHTVDDNHPSLQRARGLERG